MLSLLTILASLLALYLARFPYSLARNYIKARQTGLPIIIVPIDQNHILWMVLSVPLRPIFKKYLPERFYERLNLTTYGWEFHVGLAPFHKFGTRGNDKTFCLVTCGRTEISTCDPEISWEVLRRPRDFRMPAVTALILGKFGSNVLTSNGEDWAKQRKVVAGVINERISRAVWEESLKQTEGLLGEVYERADGKVAGTNRLFDMMKKITIHVLSGAGMGARVDWQSHAAGEKPREGYRLTYIEACKTVISAVGGPIVLPIWLMEWWPKFLPGWEFLRALAPAMVEFPIHTKWLLDEERKRARVHGGGTKRNIMSQLLQASEKEDSNKALLSEEEMMGNLFIFTAAGFDTTANTLSYALVLLCRYPQWQTWVLEEVDAVLPTDPSEAVDYAAIFPKITRIMAVMLETLRLFTPVIHIARDTQTSQTISTSRGELQIPADCFTYIDGVALHLDPDLWRDLNPSPEPAPQPSDNNSRPDEYAFRPTRWLNPPNHPGGSALFQPLKGAYVPWSAGPRVCPGQKMAQVEFVAIFLTLFRRHRIEVVPLRDGEEREESEGEWKERLDGLMMDSISVLTLQMKGVYDVGEGEGEGLRVRIRKRR